MGIAAGAEIAIGMLSVDTQRNRYVAKTSLRAIGFGIVTSAGSEAARLELSFLCDAFKAQL
jgi:hypothetical protein